MSNKIRAGEKSPALFDLGLYLFSLISIFFLKPWELNMAQRMFFAFGVFTLLGLSFISKREKEYNNKFLGFIILWSLLNVFIHTFKFSLGQSLTSGFINFCLMSEGFIYILCGCLLFYLIVNYSSNFKLFYPLLIINLLNLIFVLTQKFGIHWIWINNNSVSGMMGTCSQLAVFSALSIPLLGWFSLIPLINLFLSNSYTALCALIIVIAIYLIIKKRYLKLFILSSISFIFVLFNYQSMITKLAIRFEQWEYTLKEIVKSPIFGNGFDNSLTFNMIYSKLASGFTYRHNDFLNITRDLGLPFIIFILSGLYLILRKSKIDMLWCSVMIVLISCFFQTNIYFPRISGIAIILLALKQKQNIEDKNREITNEGLG